VYQDTPLCLSEVCQGAVHHACVGDCDACPENRTDYRLSSRTIPDMVAIQDRGRTVLISRKPLSFAGRLADLADAGAQIFRADFIWRDYSLGEIRDIWTKLRADTPVPRTHVGNLDRGLD